MTGDFLLPWPGLQDLKPLVAGSFLSPSILQASQTVNQRPEWQKNKPWLGLILNLHSLDGLVYTFSICKFNHMASGG